jgi:hypothetical protein
MKSLRMLSFAGLALAAVLAMPLASQATTCDAGCNLSVTPISPDMTSILGYFQTSGNNVIDLTGNVSGTAMGSSFSENGAISGIVNTSNDGAGNFRPGDSTTGNYFSFSNTFDGTTFDGNGLLFAFDTGNYGELYTVSGVDYLSVWLPDGNQPGGGPNFLPGEMVNLNVSATPVPEPAFLFASGLVLLIGVTYLRNKKQGLPMFGGLA